MATEVDICNLALANLGHGAKISAITPPDGSVEATHCARFYPIARKLALAKHDWAFATRRVLLAEKVVDADLYSDYEYAYALPSNYVRFVGFVDGTGLLIENHGWDYQVEAYTDGSMLLLTNCEPTGAYVRYVYDETNAGRFPEPFVDMLAFDLAAKLAGPIRKGDRRDDMLKAAGAALLFASGVDSNVDNRERRRRMDHKPAWIEGR